MRDDRVILAGVNWELPAGGWGAIVGPNGSGKSSLVRMAAGYLWPTHGTVDVLGHRLGEYPVSDLRRKISVVEALSIYPFQAFDWPIHVTLRDNRWYAQSEGWPSLHHPL